MNDSSDDSLTFQIASIAIAPGIVYEQIGIGFWGGLILIATAVAAYKASTGDAPLYSYNKYIGFIAFSKTFIHIFYLITVCWAVRSSFPSSPLFAALPLCASSLLLSTKWIVTASRVLITSSYRITLAVPMEPKLIFQRVANTPVLEWALTPYY